VDEPGAPTIIRSFRIHIACSNFGSNNSDLHYLLVSAHGYTKQ